jgi:hypothetical protein
VRRGGVRRGAARRLHRALVSLLAQRGVAAHRKVEGAPVARGVGARAQQVQKPSVRGLPLAVGGVGERLGGGDAQQRVAAQAGGLLHGGDHHQHGARLQLRQPQHAEDGHEVLGDARVLRQRQRARLQVAGERGAGHLAAPLGLDHHDAGQALHAQHRE